VIPVPAQVRPVPAATFTIGFGTAISAAPGAEHLARLLRAATGLPLPIRDPLSIRDGGAEISVVIDAAIDLGDEGYSITVEPAGIKIQAAAPAGAFWAAQTLAQLVAPMKSAPMKSASATALPATAPPAKAASMDTPASARVVIPGGQIVDRPRFPYRGVMLDVARHFWTVDEVKAYIDAIVQFKINHLHLHLTDDQGWRLEIDSRPLLTLISGGYGTGVDGAGPGYYTQADYAELVAYAAERFVTIVPEIDMPGHVNAAQAAYGELTEKGSPAEPRTDQEVGYSSLVAGLEETYAFVEDVIREVAALTPGPYLHIGGDEARATSADDYRTFMTRVLPLIAKYGKRVIGWHEMAAVDLPESAVPQFWRVEDSDEGTARAAANGNKVIMSPADRTYLDMKYTADSPLGLDWAALIEVSQSYDWDPATRLPGVGEESLLGVEAALWSETLRTLDDVMTMTFPRLSAVAEIGWSPRETHDWPAFRSRLAAYGPTWTSQGIAFHPSPEIDWR
jgi:hexosaminidase